MFLEIITGIYFTSLQNANIKDGEGNGNPLQCSCLENPRNSGAWWAAIYGVAQSQTRLKRCSGNIKDSSGLLKESKMCVFSFKKVRKMKLYFIKKKRSDLQVSVSK